MVCEILGYIFLLSLGLFIGSFLNCVIYRIRSKESFLKGRSKCPNCDHILRWHDLIPIISFFILKRKCRYCGEKISFQYPLVELATGVVFLLIFKFRWLVFSFLPAGLMAQELSFKNLQAFIGVTYLLMISCILIVIFVYDLKHYIIPDKIIFPAILITTGWYGQRLILTPGFIDSILNAFYAGLGVAVFFGIIFFLSQGEWLGFGDVKLVFFMGFVLGVPNVLVAVFSAVFMGAIIGLGLILFAKKGLRSQIPFGPFLVAGTFIALFWGGFLINWYLNILIT